MDKTKFDKMILRKYHYSILPRTPHNSDLHIGFDMCISLCINAMGLFTMLF